MEGYGKEYNNKINDDKVDFEGEYKNGLNLKGIIQTAIEKVKELNILKMGK